VSCNMVCEACGGCKFSEAWGDDADLVVYDDAESSRELLGISGSRQFADLEAVFERLGYITYTRCR
jgi:hypothetical protein